MAGRFRGSVDRAKARDYLVRSFRLSDTLSSQMDELAIATGKIYTGTLVEFWRVVRRKGIWLNEPEMRKLIVGNKRYDTGLLHSQSRQATISVFFDALSTWKANREDNPLMSPPHKKKKYFKIVWIQNGIRVRAASNIEDDSKAVLILSLGKDGNKLRIPIEIPIPKYIYDLGTPSKVEIGWRKTSPGGGYEVRCIYTRELPEIKAQDAKVAAVDLGEVHPFVITNGENTTVYNGGELRAKRRYENMIKGRLDRMISRTASGSRRRRRLVLSKRKQTGKVNRQIRDIEHKLTRRAISDLEESGVTELVIGDLRRIRQAAPSSSKSTPENPTKGRVFDQKLHQAPLGRTKHYLSYKAKRSSIYIPGLQDEAYTSQTCPVCGEKNKPTNRCYRCKRCGLLAHRDAVGSWNIRAKYLGIHLWGDFPVNVSRVVGAVAAPTGVRYRPHMNTSVLKMQAISPKSGVAVAKPI